MSPHHFSHTLLDWYAVNGRDLPWRHTRDPYAIWLSEVILQQTRIAQGMGYWERFMATYPTVEDLAAASEDDVLKLWQGLGYYSRARNLHKAARQIVALGHFPNTPEDIRQLKGVGDYTAAAIASLAYGIPVAAIDGNVYRVLARVYGISTPINTTAGKREFQELAELIVQASTPKHKDEAQPDRPFLLNQALMDFGATQCTPKSPNCLLCPLAEECVALRQGKVEDLPVKRKTIQQKERRLTYIYIRHKGQTAIHQRGAGDIWQGLWEPLLIEDAPQPDLKGTLIPLRQRVKHVLSHRILLADFFLLNAEERPSLPQDYIWINEEDIDHYAVPRLIEILLASITHIK
ncbi:MAG: A/G-specific adenine glycosylase [Prevotella sp.]|nr:A/G-specific adenine glycosylase [Prevotella sp.]